MNHRIFRTRCLLVVGMSFAAHSRAGDLPTLPAPIKRNLEYRIEAKVAPGIAVGLINEHGVMTYGYGVKTPGSEEKINRETVFEIGSITKAFTGTLLADAARRGEVSLDDPVQKHLPADVHMPVGENRPITLRDLATHVSGLPRLPANLLPGDPTNPYANFTADELHKFLSAYTLPVKVGEKYAYSNLGAGLLGHVLGRVQGKSYEELVVERIAEPLGMSSTALTISADMRARLARGHNQHGKQVPNWDFAALAGCGAIRSTTSDMLRFLAANMGLIDSDLLPAMRDAWADPRDIGSESVRVGLGWHTLGEGDRLIVWHNGRTGGYGSFCGFVPARKRGVVILANASVRIDDLGRHLLDESFPLEFVRPPVRLSIETLERYTGTYRLDAERLLHITRVGETLFAHVNDRPSVAIHPETETRFAYDIIDAQLEFIVEGDGPATAVVMTVEDSVRRAPRVDRGDTAIVHPRILRSYVGRYEYEPGKGFDIGLQEQHLTIQPDGQTTTKLHPRSDTEFTYAGGEIKVRFERNERDIADKLIILQSNRELHARRTRKPPSAP